MTPADADIPAVEIDPLGPPRACIIWLHGLGADGHDFAPIVPELNLPAEHQVRFVFPHAPLRPITINRGYIMRAWYDVTDAAFNEDHDFSSIRASTAAIHGLIEREIERGISSRRIVLAGFSQGGCIALHAGLSFPQALAGIMALSTYTVTNLDPEWRFAPANATTPVFMAHGMHDTVIPHRFGERSAALLRERGCPVEWHSYPMAHSVCPAEVADISRWLKRVLNR